MLNRVTLQSIPRPRELGRESDCGYLGIGREDEPKRGRHRVRMSFKFVRQYYQGTYWRREHSTMVVTQSHQLSRSGGWRTCWCRGVFGGSFRNLPLDSFAGSGAGL